MLQPASPMRTENCVLNISSSISPVLSDAQIPRRRSRVMKMQRRNLFQFCARLQAPSLNVEPSQA